MTRLLCLALLTPALAFAAPAKSPGVDRTEAFIQGLLKVKSDDGKLTAKDKEANQKAFTELDGYFDFDQLTLAPIQNRLAKFSPAEKADYQKKFRELLRLIAYPDSGAFFKKAKYEIGEAKTEGDLVTVPINAHKVEDDIKTQVDIHWKLIGKDLKIFDVSFDGDSLVKDYGNQFAKIVDKEGAKGLIEKIDKKRADLDKPVKAK